MLKYTDTEVVLKEVPDEITLAINISNCPHHCPGCHSPELWEDVGNTLDEDSIKNLISKNRGISCVALMGGDNNVERINELAGYIKKEYSNLKVAWYSGYTEVPDKIELSNFDFIKVGPYIKDLGGLDSSETNQIFYKISDKSLIDITNRFQEKRF